MKKLFIVILVIIFVSGATTSVVFYLKNWPGLKPVLEKPPQDISKIMNTTGMPLKLPPGFSISIFAIYL